MPDIQAHLPDGKTVLHFPDGTDPSVIQGVVKKQLGIGANPYSEAGAAANPPQAPINWQAVQGVPPSQFESDVVKGQGFDPNAIANRRPGLHQWAEVLNQALKGMGQFGSAVAKDPYHITDPISGMATGIETAAKNKSPGQMVGAASNVAMGMEVANPEVPKSAASLKAGVADATYKRGLGVAEHLKSASQNIDNAVGQAAQSFVSKVDKKFPEGAIDPKPIMEGVNKLKADIVKTPEKYPPNLAQMLEPEAKKTTGPRIMGGHLDLSDPQQLASYQKMKASGAFTPEEIARMEGPTSDKWTAEEAKQWRTKISSAIGKTEGPMKAVLQDARDNLTTQLRKAADQSDALSDFQEYNNLHRKHMRFLEDPIIQKIMGGDTSKETLAPLADPEKMIHVQNMLDDWDKFGIKTEDLAKEGSDYSKAKALMERKRFRWFPGGTLGGVVGGHVLGLPWGVGAAGGLALDRMLSGAGKASRFIESSKTSPFYGAGEARAADISRGWSEGLPEISAKKVALKAAKNK